MGEDKNALLKCAQHVFNQSVKADFKPQGGFPSFETSPGCGEPCLASAHPTLGPQEMAHALPACFPLEFTSPL